MDGGERTKGGFLSSEGESYSIFNSGLPPVMGSVLDKVSDDSKVLAINF